MSFKLYNKWDEFNYDDAKDKKALAVALQFFCALPDAHVPKQFQGRDDLSKKFREKQSGMQKAQIQAYTNLNDFPATPKEVIDNYHELTVYDNGYEQVFDVRDYSSSRRDGFSIATTASSLVFRKIKTGEKLYVYGMSGEQEFVYFDYYGGALGWDKKLFDNQDWWTIEDNAIEFRNEAFRIRAATFYALIEAVTGSAGFADIAWQVSVDTLAAGTRGYIASRDVQTMNIAAQTILLATQNSGYGVSAQNISFIVLAPGELRNRVKMALNYTLDNVPGSPTLIDYRFTPVITTMLTVTDHYWVILPKLKAKAGYRMDLTTFTAFDMLSYTESAAGWMAFGGGIGDTDQFERCDTA